MRNLWPEQGTARATVLIVFAALIVILGFCIAWYIPIGHITFSPALQSTTTTQQVVPIITHIATPEPVRGVYMTGCTASEKRLRDKVIAVINGTEVNSLVIDYKDYTGTISYASTTLQTGDVGRGCRIRDLPEFLAELHSRGIYTIGRITIFQDPLYASQHISSAIRKKSDPKTTWKDVHGLAYVDPGAKVYWDHVVDMVQEAYAIGFDEINFDYIRFPSDGDLKNMLHSAVGSTTKSMVIKNFFSYIHSQLASSSIPTSADLFGLTTSAVGDMGIGQILENALPYFDYIAPMVYPSHFAKGFNGFSKPAEHPYEVIKSSMDRAVERAIAASTTPAKMRPWLQAFDLGAVYTPAMVRAQMQATYDAGLTGWLLWNAGSSYKREYFLKI